MVDICRKKSQFGCPPPPPADGGVRAQGRVLAAVDVPDHLALLLVQPHGHGEVEAGGLGQDAGLEVDVVVDVPACYVDVAEGVGVEEEVPGAQELFVLV